MAMAYAVQFGSVLRPGLCAGLQSEGVCYEFHQETLPWAEAELRCVAEGGHLVSVTSPRENLFVQALCSAECWIGCWWEH